MFLFSIRFEKVVTGYIHETTKVAVIMGSDSDFPVVKKAIKVLKDMDIDVEARVISAIVPRTKRRNLPARLVKTALM